VSNLRRLSVAAQIDPAAKLMWLFLVSVAGSLLMGASQLIAVTVLVALAFALCDRAELATAWKFRFLVLFIPALLLVYHSVLGPLMAGGSWRIGDVRWSSASYSIKILNSVLALTFFLSTTDMRQLVNRLAKLGLPVGAAFSIYLMLRFVEILRVDAASVRDALRMHRRSGRLRFARYPATLVLLGMHRANQTATAMDLRGFPGGPGRTFFGTRYWSPIGWLLPVGTGLAIIAVSFFLSRA